MTVALASLAPPDAIAEGRAALYAGDPLAAATLFNAAAQDDPADHESRYWLYSALVACAQPDAARTMLDEARTLHAVAAIRGAGADMARFETDKAYCAQIGYQLYAGHLMGEASVALGRALDFDNLDPRLMLSYGLSLQHQGRLPIPPSTSSCCTRCSSPSGARGAWRRKPANGATSTPRP
jgi:protein O-GlcNAc transferase